MPILNVKVSATRSPALTKAIAEMLLEHTTRILHKNRDLTAIAIDYVHPDDWIVGGQALSAQGRNSFYFDIKVVDETNTKSEKAQYIEEVFAAFRRLLGELHPESYSYIEDVRPTTYGFGERLKSFGFTISPDGFERKEKPNRLQTGAADANRTAHRVDKPRPSPST